MNELVPLGLGNSDPATLGFPPMLAVELAMHVATPKEVCEAYGLSRDEFMVLVDNPVFIKAYNNARDELRKDGVSFRLKARMQAEKLLERSWILIHADNTPTTVQADLIKSTMKWAGYEKSDGPGNTGVGFSININL